MKIKDMEKLASRRQELLARTAKMFGVSVYGAEKLFQPRKSTVTVIDERAKELINRGVENGELMEIAWYKDAYVINSNKSLFTQSKEAENGYVLFQNASSLLAPLALDPQPNETILDMCAAPGGKTVQLFKLSNNQAKITVNDESFTRTAIMKGLFAKYRTDIVAYYSQPAQYLAKHLPLESFDKILLDAPCSGEGIIDLTKPASLKFWSTKKIGRLSKLQKSLLRQAYNLIKPGGTIIYSTCTCAPEENEEVIDWAVTKLNLHAQKVKISSAPDNINHGLLTWKGKTFSSVWANALRVIPNDYMEPFFVCKLVKGDKIGVL